MGLTPGAARRWLEQNKVPLVDFGPGRGKGPRWPKDHVLEAVERNLRFAAEQPRPRKLAMSNPISGRSTADILADIARARPVQ